MSCKRTIQQWRHAIEVLNSDAAEFSGMEDKILPLLKYSYDNLKGKEVKSCLLYCALYPEDHKNFKETLIEYWICEGIIDGSEGIENAENEGYDIIGSLVCASLLMEVVDYRGSCVSMHDVVREMALWIASDLGKQKEAFIVRAGVGFSKIPHVKNWKVVRKMSLMENKIHHLAGSHECLELTTLLLQKNRNLSNISSEFFKSMPKLVVLDLSYNYDLLELPEEISNLVSLQYLSLSCTGIRHLPKGLQELNKLINFDLENTESLESIAGISSLQNLKVLKLYNCLCRWDRDTVDELEGLEHLEILTMQANHSSTGAKQYFCSHRLMSCTQSLGIFHLTTYGISLPETMDKLRTFKIDHCSISAIMMESKCSFSSLSEVSIRDCKGLRELTFLMFAPNLTVLDLHGVNELKDIINKKEASQVENSRILPFPKLNDLRLADLQKLKNIYWSPLPFPCLQTIYVKECPNLKKLPLNSKSGKHGENRLTITHKEKEWIEGLEWEDEATESRFLPSCRWEHRIT